jgi:hypothetical protein
LPSILLTVFPLKTEDFNFDETQVINILF